jgi:predicted Zn-dependent protease
MTTQNYFNSVADHIHQQLLPGQVFTCMFSGEESDFVRFNQAKVRQAGSVKQGMLHLDLISGQKHLLSSLSLSGNYDVDFDQIKTHIKSEQAKLNDVPNDPYLLYATEVNSTQTLHTNHLPDAHAAVNDVLKRVQGLDFVGIYAAGATHRGFANSFGQRNWLSSHSFNLDFSCYLHHDKAVKSSYAGSQWDLDRFDQEIALVKEKLKTLAKPAQDLKPGQYRTYLTPTAFHDITSLMTWGGLSEKAMRTKFSPLLRLHEGEESLHPSFSFCENTADGIGPSFQSGGFIKAPRVPLISEGKLTSCLISPRSAKEFGIATNGANAGEVPEAMDVAGGHLSRDAILKELDTGLYVNNLWYLNYSDRPACRMTGMTRFATFWVEKGQIKAPLNVMRFDDSLYRMLGSNLVGFTKERDFIIDNGTYDERATSSARLPGVLIDNFNLTL